MNGEVRAGLIGSGITAAALTIGALVFVASQSQDQPIHQHSPNAEISSDTQPTPQAPSHRFTKEEFDKYAYLRTKAQIRQEFGSPNTVDDASDSWYYWNLPVYDAEAGTHPTVILRFGGEAGSSDSVVEVRYTSG